MFGAIVMGVGLSTAQSTAQDDTFFLDRFVGEWRGVIDYPQWIQDEIQQASMQFGKIDDEYAAGFKLPVLTFNISIARDGDNMIFQMKEVKALDSDEFTFIDSLLSLFRVGGFVSEGEPIRLSTNEDDQSAMFQIYRGRARVCQRRHRAVFWDESVEIELVKSRGQRSVLQLVGDKYLALHIFNWRPKLTPVFSVFMSRTNTGNATPTR